MAAASLLEATRLLSTPRPRPLPPRRGLHPHLLRTPPRVSSLRAHLHRPAPLDAQEQEPPARPGALLVLDALRRSVLDTLAALKRPALALLLAGALLAALAGGPHAAALAASGGRVGGSAFSSRSSSPPSYGYSAPAPRGGGYRAAPFYSPSPFVSVGPAIGIGFGGSGFLFTLIGFAAFLYLAGFLSDSSGSASVLTDTEKTTVLKLQVGLLGMARSFQKELDQIAEKADTSTPAGLSYVLTETTLALLRHPDCCISGYSSVDVKRSMDDGEKRFNQLSIEERGKFDEETLVNVNSIKRNKGGSQRSSGFSNEYIVITILVAAEGVHKLPVINSSNHLKTALQKMGAIPSSKILAVEVLWTPQNENDTLSERELLEDYPLLRPL
ncbi:FLUCTUATING-LIGHT-ACCLIMATION protein 1, chloroplastic-like [Miscanthus floridulus]|uniref:FLUCTUATING-LIGHT-ACCLIMATION protein 1, chloroplastic-like n=1 Tax=Miscanthus floridulus TaxID=154761 RepID=UPI00345A7EF7